MPIIGIDLGTTNSLAAYWNGKKAVLIPNALGEVLTPSVVSMDDDGSVFVGKVAKERLISHPLATAAVFKRFMGSKKQFKLAKKTFLPEELSAFIIRSLKEDAEAHLGVKVEEAVISVPAYFNDSQRRATKRAGELAGIRVERLISEPTAAAMAYGIHQNEPESKCLIFDLGGGTFDVSIVERFENLIEVKAVAGDNYLGGEDFTACLADIYLKKVRKEKRDWNEKSKSLLWQQAERCKKQLSQQETAEMNVVDEEARNLLRCEISRTEFGDAAAELTGRLRQPVERALRDAEMQPSELESVILVGGATRMPLIHSVVSRMFGRLPACSLNPDEVVAIGAAVQAGMKERDSALKENVLTDVCPYTLGIEVVKSRGRESYERGFFAPIIERNMGIPISREERFHTVANAQTEIAVEVFQGESRHTKNNMYLGTLTVRVPAAPAGEQSIAVRFTYDINGILEVEATVLETGVVETLIIEENEGSMSSAEIKKRLEKLKDIKIHPRERQEYKLLIARGERMHEEFLGERRQEVDMILRQFEIVMDRQDEEDVKKQAEITKRQLDELEGKIKQ